MTLLRPRTRREREFHDALWRERELDARLSRIYAQVVTLALQARDALAAGDTAEAERLLDRVPPLDAEWKASR